MASKLSVIPSAPNAFSPFLQYLWNIRPVKFYPADIQSGVSFLREATGLTREQFAKRLFLSTNQLNNLESFGRPCYKPTLDRLAYVATDYRLFEFVRFFTEYELSIRAKRTLSTKTRAKK